MLTSFTFFLTTPEINLFPRTQDGSLEFDVYDHVDPDILLDLKESDSESEDDEQDIKTTALQPATSKRSGSNHFSLLQSNSLAKHFSQTQFKGC